MNPRLECRFQVVASNLEKMVSGAPVRKQLPNFRTVAVFPNGESSKCVSSPTICVPRALLPPVN